MSAARASSRHLLPSMPLVADAAMCSPAGDANSRSRLRPRFPITGMHLESAVGRSVDGSAWIATGQFLPLGGIQ
jgi:hypothetical protein